MCPHMKSFFGHFVVNGIVGLLCFLKRDQSVDCVPLFPTSLRGNEVIMLLIIKQRKPHVIVLSVCTYILFQQISYTLSGEKYSSILKISFK